MKDRKKTKAALKKALKMFLSMLPQFIYILLLMGLLLAIFDADTIRSYIGAESGLTGMVISALTGSISLIPALIAFPVASELLNNGAGIMQIAVFISTLTTVGFVTVPIEIKYLGKKIALLRNILFSSFHLL